MTIFAMLVPQAMAYGELAGVAPVFGLYTAIGALVGYALFGSSRRLMLGPESSSALVWQGMRLRRWGKRVSRARSHLHTWVPSVLTDGILPRCLLLGPPIVLTILGDAPCFSPVKDWEMLLLIAPDIGYTLLAIATILLVIGKVKLIWVSRQLVLR